MAHVVSESGPGVEYVYFEGGVSPVPLAHATGQPPRRRCLRLVAGLVPAGPFMTRWEYAQLHTTREISFNSYLYNAWFIRAGEREHVVDNERKISFVALINQFGEEGWEAFHIETFNGLFNSPSVANVASWVERRIWLKRPKP